MHLRLNSAISGQNFAYQSGDVLEWPDEVEANRMVERGIAEELTPPAAKEAAAAAGRPVRVHKRIETAEARRKQLEKAATR